MKAILCNATGVHDDVLTMKDDVAVPLRGAGQLLIKTFATSLCPADVRLMSGDLSFVLNPKTWPYVPGIELSGVVEACDPNSSKFKVGDRVYANNGASGSNSGFAGGLAQYAVVNESSAVVVPVKVGDLEAAAIGGILCAVEAVREAAITPNDRVLVLGGSSGIGTCVVQLVRHAGAAYVAATSTDEPLLTRLGANRVINYRTVNWWEESEYQDAPFTVVIEVTSGGQRGVAWSHAKSTKALKSGWEGGRFVSLDFGPSIVKNPIQLLDFIQSLMLNSTVVWPFYPRYKAVLVMPNQTMLVKAMELLDTEAVTIVLDPSCPFPFTLEGVNAAFRLQSSSRAHGRVVIKI